VFSCIPQWEITRKMEFLKILRGFPLGKRQKTMRDMRRGVKCFWTDCNCLHKLPEFSHQSHIFHIVFTICMIILIIFKFFLLFPRRATEVKCFELKLYSKRTARFARRA